MYIGLYIFHHILRNYLCVLNIIITDHFVITYFSVLLFSYLSKLLFFSLRAILMKITETLNQITLFQKTQKSIFFVILFLIKGKDTTF